ncbi:MAG: polysaccharide pyruvyl transferase family protein, partial [Rikenellaceae bacterium]
EWDIKRIAYAASFGTEEWEYTPKQTVACGSLIKAFDKVAVREFSAIDLCKIYFDITAECVVDPTMLLEMTDYIELIRKYIPISDSDNNSHNHRGNLTVYMLDGSDDKNKVVDQVAITMNLTQCQINKNKDRNIDVHERVQPSIESWLYAFYNADFVVTDSFHGCVFSIIFNKPFIVYGNKDRGLARFSSLLSMFNLQNRYISSFDELKSDLYDDINWQEVNTVLKEQRQRSQQFLSELLN